MDALINKIAIVTGAASRRGMGRAIALKLVGEGANVIVGCMDLGELVAGLGFGDGVVEEPIEAGVEGLADVAVDDGAFEAELAGKSCDVAVIEVGFVVECGDEVEVAFGVDE